MTKVKLIFSLSMLWMSACDQEIDRSFDPYLSQQIKPIFKSSKSIIDKSCEARCDGHFIIDDQCNMGDCSAYGTTCIADPIPRCGTPECPRTGEATVCLDEHMILSCRDGALTAAPGDCSIYGAWCSTAGVSLTEARCVSALCYDRNTVPYDREVCSINTGFKLACYADSTIEEVPCPSGQICSVEGGDVHCRSPISNCATPSHNEEVIDHYLCLEGGGIGWCYNGNIINEVPCGLESECTTLGGLVHCAESACLNQEGHIVNGPICRSNVELIECDDNGVVISQIRCDEQEYCEGEPGHSRCHIQEEAVTAGDSMMESDLNDSHNDEDTLEETTPLRDRSPSQTTYQREGDETDEFVAVSCAQRHNSIPSYVTSLPLPLYLLLIFISFARWRYPMSNQE